MARRPTATTCRTPTRSRSSACARRARSCVGKTNTPEWGAGSHTFNPVFGATRNAWDTTRSAGGSSGGGAVALACRMVPIADGSDLGGSLRNPAAWSGVLGLRPTPGLVPRWPVSAPWLPFAVEGPMARTAGDLALLLAAMAGPDARDPLSQRRGASRPRAAVRASRERPARGLEPDGGRPADRPARQRGPGGSAPLLREAGLRCERGRARLRRRRRGLRDLARVHVGDRARRRVRRPRRRHEGHGACRGGARARADVVHAEPRDAPAGRARRADASVSSIATTTSRVP